jgi:hypothetical protein
MALGYPSCENHALFPFRKCFHRSVPLSVMSQRSPNDSSKDIKSPFEFAGILHSVKVLKSPSFSAGHLIFNIKLTVPLLKQTTPPP